MVIDGKKIAFLGDSMTEGYGASSYDYCLVGRFAKKYLEAKVYNYGIGATRIADQQKPSAMYPHLDHKFFSSRVDQMEENCDVIIIWGGTNDWDNLADALLGTALDTTPHTFFGGLINLFERIQKKYPVAKVIVLTPLHRLNDQQANNRGYYLAEYVEAIKTTAARYGFLLLDLYSKIDINPNDPVSAEKFTFDALHPNDEGYRIIFECLDDYLQSIDD